MIAPLIKRAFWRILPFALPCVAAMAIAFQPALLEAHHFLAELGDDDCCCVSTLAADTDSPQQSHHHDSNHCETCKLLALLAILQSDTGSCLQPQPLLRAESEDFCRFLQSQNTPSQSSRAHSNRAPPVAA